MTTVINPALNGGFSVQEGQRLFIAGNEDDLKTILTSLGLLIPEPTRDPSSRTRIGDHPAAGCEGPQPPITDAGAAREECLNRRLREDRQAVPLYDFGSALQVVKNGGRIARGGWNGKGMWVEFAIAHPESSFRSFLVMKTANDERVPWVASQTDLLADDWYIVA